MRLALAILLAICVASSASALECEEWFDCVDGALPALLVSTGDPNDTGAFAVQSGALAHTQLGTAHYVWLCQPGLPVDGLQFDVSGARWEFAWRISMGDAASGTCLLLSHDDRSGQWAYSLSAISWWSPDPVECPECQFVWHNGTAEWTVLHPTGGPADGWHHVRIEHAEPFPPLCTVLITVDGEQVFLEDCEATWQPGLVGLGCSGAEVGTPAFDNLSFSWPDVVQQSAWGVIKGLYR